MLVYSHNGRHTTPLYNRFLFLWNIEQGFGLGGVGFNLGNDTPDFVDTEENKKMEVGKPLLNNTSIWGDILCSNCAQRLSAWADTLHGCCALCGHAFPEEFQWLRDTAIKEKEEARKKATELSLLVDKRELQVREVILLSNELALTGIGQQWTVATAVQHRWKYSPQSFPSRYADITLRVDPYDGLEKCVFVNAIPPEDALFVQYDGTEEEPFWQDCITGVMEGVEDALRGSAELGFPVTGLSVALIEMRIHPVDSNRSVCRQVAAGLVSMCLKRDNLVEYGGVQHMDAEGEFNVPVGLSWKRMSKTEAAEEAKRLAVGFLRSQKTNGWDWVCDRASPDLYNTLNGGRRTPRYWCVLVRYSKKGVLLDGSAVLHVDLENGAVKFL